MNCKFYNTAQDMRDCLDSLMSALNGSKEDKINSFQEVRGLMKMLDMSAELIQLFGGEADVNDCQSDFEFIDQVKESGMDDILDPHIL